MVGIRLPTTLARPVSARVSSASFFLLALSVTCSECRGQFRSLRFSLERTVRRGVGVGKGRLAAVTSAQAGVYRWVGMRLIREGGREGVPRYPSATNADPGPINLADHLTTTPSTASIHCARA